MNENEMRELDAWIAEHVMGMEWVVFESENGNKWCSLINRAPWIERRGGTIVSERPKDAKFDGDIPSYRTDPADAMEVLKKCRDAGWLITVKIIPEEYSYIIEGARSEYDAPCEDRECCKGKVMVEGMNMTNREDWQRHETFAHTLELAICLFAKKLFSQQIPHNESPTSDRDAIRRTGHT